MKSVIRPMGNSQGILIPKPVLEQLGMARDQVVTLEIDGDCLVMRKPRPALRDGWAEAAATIAGDGEGKPAWPSFANAGDDDLKW
jgi:antitoxin MazE